ncbi:MAG: endopeptidase La [Schleiferiaceae bacterium]|nr:endopeptidase La [Schleiferiaceae bacterium]
MERTAFSLHSEETDFIPLITNEEDNSIPDSDLLEEISLLPLRNTVQFPGVVSPITAGRDKSIKLVQGAQKGKKLFGVLAQKDPDTETPGGEHLHSVGTLVQMVKSFKMPDGNITAILQGKRRFRIIEVISEEPFLKAKVEYLNDIKAADSTEFRALIQHIREMAMDIIQESPNIPTEAQIAVKNIESDTFLIHFIASNMNLDVEKKQAILEEDDISKRTNAVLKHLSYEKHLLEVKNDIANRVRTEFDQQQREYFLQQQMKTIQEELGGVSNEAEIQLMRDRAEKMDWPDIAAKQFDKEIQRLQRMSPQVPDFGIQRNYLEFILDLPWNKLTVQPIKLSKARRVLDRDHFGLDKVKERLLEHLAVLKLKDDMRSPILCLYGPPGVGKTSLGKSIAEALGRDYIRMSLGGLRDESEIRGHRKTYIGAMAGRILQLIKKAGSSNPVFVLDEIDKLGFGVQGDPSSALLEVLDPEQNKTFYDNFLEMGYDLSKVLFIATANTISTVQPALRDRMELIEVNGYTMEEKEQIGKKYLLPKQLEEHGLDKNSIKIGKSEMIDLIDNYTRESGVRNLNRELAKLARKAALSKAEEKEFPSSITSENLIEIMGAPRFDRDVYQGNDIAGVVTGLAWTPVGGDILFIETSISLGSGKLNITGNLGDVMKESASIAMAYLKGNSDKYNLDNDLFTKYDVHIHVPEGSIPKDGPSAGIAILTALTSLFTQKKVKNRLALSGEITLRGKVLPVGGVREKLLAAKRSGITNIILSGANKKDVLEIPSKYLSGISFNYVDSMEGVLSKAVLDQKVKTAKELPMKN